MELNRYFEIRIYGVSNELATTKGELIHTQDNQSILVLRTNDTYINNPQYFGIAEGSMNLEEILCDGEFTLGALCSDKFEVELFNICEDLSGLDIQVDVTENGITSRLFTGIIDSSTTDNNNYSRNIVAYDKGYYLRDKECVEIWDSYWESNEVKTLKGLRDYLVTQVGLEYISKSLPNDSFVITQSDFTSITFGDLLQSITELQSVIPHINRSGVLDFITLPTSSSFSCDSSAYEGGSVDFEDYTTKPITGIKLYSTSDNLTQEYKVGSDNENAYTISGNIFLLDSDSDSVNTVLKNIYDTISDVVYTPVTMPMIVSDLTYSLGIKYQSSRGYHYIFSQTYSGTLLIEQELKCEASGETREQTASSINNSMIQGKKFSKIEQTIDGISTTVSRVEQVATDAKTTANEAKTDAENAQGTADEANTNAQTSLTLASEVSQTADALTTRVSAVEEGTTTNASHITQIQQTANSLQLSVEQNGSNIESIQTCLLIKVDGVYVLAQTADSSTDLSNLSYTKLTADGVDIFSKGDRVAYFRSDGTYSRDFITNGWHMQAANNNNSFNFIRKDYNL